MLNPIIVTTSELAQIFKCDQRTISRLATSGILERSVERGKYELLTSVANYVMHLRRVASGLTTQDAKLLALTALTQLRDAQRAAIEQKSSKDFMKTEDVRQAFRSSAILVREKILELPVKLRRKIEDNHPSLIASRAEAVQLETDLEDCVYEVMDAIADEPVAALEAAE